MRTIQTRLILRHSSVLALAVLLLATAGALVGCEDDGGSDSAADASTEPSDTDEPVDDTEPSEEEDTGEEGNEEPEPDTEEPDVDEPEPEPDPVAFTLMNNGTPVLEGHTPTGFMGSGTGLFVGDNLNANFPDGVGVHTYLSFALDQVPAGTVTGAVLSSENSSITGTPFADLGALQVVQVSYDQFGSTLWDLEAGEVEGCTLATTAEGPYSCDISAIAQAALDSGATHVQVRLAFDTPGDEDGEQDMVFFFLGQDPNANQAGIFELALTVVPAE